MAVGSEFSIDEKYARMAHLYVLVCTLALGDYSKDAQENVAEYYFLKKEIEKELGI